MLKLIVMKKYLYKLSPSKLLVLSFFSVIAVGTFLLSLPITNQKEVLPFIDNLFTATSSTCVTGLITTIPAIQYNFLGQLIILIMIQIGGLGLMTFISVFMLFVRARLDFKQRIMLKDSFNKDNLQDIPSYITMIIKYTFFFEIIGFIILSFIFVPEYGISGYFKALFVAISAFCNAGIDILGASSLQIYRNNLVVNLTVAFLIISGGLGFACWFDLKNNLKLFTKSKFIFKKFVHNLRVNTKLVLIITASLLLIGTIIIFIFEYNNSLKEFNFFEKIIASFFTSTTLRTAGFSTIDFSILLSPTKIIMMIFMLIGGSPGGSAGGIKTTTFFLLLLIIISEIKNKGEMTVFNKHIHKRNFIKAYTIISFYIVVIFNSIIIVSFTDPQIKVIDSLFEIVSAISTVGLSIVSSQNFSLIGKIIIIICMFIGRVGPITIAYSLHKSKRKDNGLRYPATEIIVG